MAYRLTQLLIIESPNRLIRALQWMLFVWIVRHLPVNDDRERAFCVNAGEIGHTQCGWCGACERLVMSCMCHLHSIQRRRVTF